MKIAGRSYWLWRAVDQHGVVLEEILQSRRDKCAAKRLLVKPIKRWDFVPKKIITDKLRSYDTAKREVALGLEHWSHKVLNNRAEKSHLPFRKRERVMQGFRLPGGLQRFVSMQSATRSCISVPAPVGPLSPSVRSIRGVEIRGKYPLMNIRHANLQIRRVNVTTPCKGLGNRPCPRRRSVGDL
ncbi:transposase [Sulfitobacter profundi]|uniref:Transposase n=1 Tax=Sulfitobacter profundi TaxID=2679961 RepID=A0ABW1Z2T3_9RHOB